MKKRRLLDINKRQRQNLNTDLSDSQPYATNWGAANYSPQAKFVPDECLAKKFYRNMATITGLHTVYGWFQAETAEVEHKAMTDTLKSQNNLLSLHKDC